MTDSAKPSAETGRKETDALIARAIGGDQAAWRELLNHDRALISYS
jgi:hypothetical protein